MMLLIWMAGCADTTTTERTFVGRVSDAAGAPVKGLVMQSMEAQSHTDEAGRVAVHLKSEVPLVHFTVGGTWYRYRLQPADQGTVVDLTLPVTRSMPLGCPPIPCDLQLRWALTDGLEAISRPACTPQAEVTLEGVPAGQPEVICSVGKGTAKRRHAVALIEAAASWRVVEQGAAVQVHVQAIDGELPEDCAVRVGGRVARAVEGGGFTAEASVPVTVGAVCGGVPAVPVWTDPTAPGGDRVTLEWASSGPVADIVSLAPWAEEVVVAAESAGWSMSLAPDAEGGIRLPPLAAGTYRILLRSAEATLPLAATPPSNVPNGVLTLTPVDEGTMVGRLTLAEDLQGGTVRVALGD